MLTPARRILIVSAAIPLGLWAFATPTVVDGFERGYSSGLEEFLTGLTVVAAALTIGGLVLVIQAWRRRVRPVYAVLVLALAAMSVVVLSVAIGLGG
ncbi:MAG TPA: hypothetical protein VGH79_11990 [Gaiellaceae bacterium]|jgi:hypothetical protein